MYQTCEKYQKVVKSWNMAKMWKYGGKVENCLKMVKKLKYGKNAGTW